LPAAGRRPCRTALACWKFPIQRGGQSAGHKCAPEKTGAKAVDAASGDDNQINPVVDLEGMSEFIKRSAQLLDLALRIYLFQTWYTERRLQAAVFPASTWKI